MKAKASNGAYIETGDTVLVRESDTRTWYVSLFSYKIKDNYFICANGSSWAQCIPLKGNEHLCGTNDEYEEPYIPKFGDMVEGITHTNEKVSGILVGCSTTDNNYTLLEVLPKNDGFISKYNYCKSVKPIKK